MCLSVCVCEPACSTDSQICKHSNVPQTCMHTDAHRHTHIQTCTHIYIASPNRYTCTFPTVISSVSRETSSLSWYTSHKWIFNPAPPGGYLRKGFNWFKTNNYEPYFPAKSIFIHGCLHSEAVVLGWLGCTPPSPPPFRPPSIHPSLLVRGRELQCGCPFILGARGVDACLSLPGSDAPQSDV